MMSWLVIGHMNKIFHRGLTEDKLEVKHLGHINEEDCVSTVSVIFDAAWEKELLLPREKRSLWRPIFKVTGYFDLIRGLIFQAISSGASFGPPLLLKELAFHVSGFSQYQLPDDKLWLYITLLLVLPIIGVIFGAQASIIFCLWIFFCSYCEFCLTILLHSANILCCSCLKHSWESYTCQF